jgi:hypothetical protein
MRYYRYYVKRRFRFGSHGTEFGQDASLSFSDEEPKIFIEKNCPDSYKLTDGKTEYFDYILIVHIISKEDYDAGHKYSIPLQKFTLYDVKGKDNWE